MRTFSYAVMVPPESISTSRAAAFPFSVSEALNPMVALDNIPPEDTPIRAICPLAKVRMATPPEYTFCNPPLVIRKFSAVPPER